MKIDRAFIRLSPVLLAATMAFTFSNVVDAGIMGFGNFSGFQINQVDSAAAPVISLSPSEIHLTGTTSNSEDRSIFDRTVQSTSQFTASFTYQATGIADGESGFAFVLQNSGAGSGATGSGFLIDSGGFGGLGYFGISPSAAVEFPLATPFASGVFTNGNIGAGTDSLSPVNLVSGDPINVVITYDGTFLRETLTDTVTGQSSATGLHLISLPATAYVGITAATDGGQDQLFSNFEFTNAAVPEPSSLALLGTGAGALCLVWRRTKRRALANIGELKPPVAT